MLSLVMKLGVSPHPPLLKITFWVKSFSRDRASLSLIVGLAPTGESACVTVLSNKRYWFMRRRPMSSQHAGVPENRLESLCRALESSVGS